jgi:hypothetical protein
MKTFRVAITCVGKVSECWSWQYILNLIKINEIFYIIIKIPISRLSFFESNSSGFLLHEELIPDVGIAMELLIECSNYCRDDKVSNGKTAVMKLTLSLC